MDTDAWMREIAKLVQQREEKRYAWLRHLLLLAAGSLSVLVSLRTGASTVGFQHYCIVTALASLGLGILFGAFSLHGEVWLAGDVVKRMGEEAIRLLKNSGTSDEPISCQLPARYDFAERSCYFSFVVSVISLVIYAIIGN
jgi:hypothetical protein